ncbi:uncharacterized protein LOC131666903 [Phymastichus coffea]|uniref:uncharacterized protein LOC131666903 n=1 Tax=Phymastichus coffea TaxID=108790 RepID=UPI00273CEC25|nr:uncharacterized protein LOC131666903 [Phymastichus coffea]
MKEKENHRGKYAKLLMIEKDKLNNMLNDNKITIKTGGEDNINFDAGPSQLKRKLEMCSSNSSLMLPKIPRIKIKHVLDLKPSTSHDSNKTDISTKVPTRIEKESLPDIIEPSLFASDSNSNFLLDLEGTSLKSKLKSDKKSEDVLIMDNNTKRDAGKGKGSLIMTEKIRKLEREIKKMTAKYDILMKKVKNLEMENERYKSLNFDLQSQVLDKLSEQFVNLLKKNEKYMFPFYLSTFWEIQIQSKSKLVMLFLIR